MRIVDGIEIVSIFLAEEIATELESELCAEIPVLPCEAGVETTYDVGKSIADFLLGCTCIVSGLELVANLEAIIVVGAVLCFFVEGSLGNGPPVERQTAIVVDAGVFVHVDVVPVEADSTQIEGIG